MKPPPSRFTPRVIWWLFRETFVEWYEDRAPRLGAGLLLGKEAAQGPIIGQVQDLADEAGAQAVRAAIESARNAGGSLLATGLGVITGSGVSSGN